MKEHREPEHPLGEPPAGGAQIGEIDPEEAMRAVAEAARESPRAALAGAFAIGFLLGGGLTPRLLASLVLFAGRRYAAEAAREALGSALRERIAEFGGEAPPRSTDEVAAP